MIILSLASADPLAGCGPRPLLSGAYDGETYCFTAAGSCSIFRYDNCLRALDPVQTPARYTAICYDPGNCCYWAVREQIGHAVYQLDCSFRETDALALRVQGACGAPININYNSGDRSLTLTYSNGTADFHPGGACSAVLEPAACGTMLRSVLQTGASRFEIRRQGAAQSLAVERCGEQQEFFFPFEYALRDIIETDNRTFRVLAMKNSQYPYLLTMELSGLANASGIPAETEAQSCSPMRLWIPNDVR